MDHRLSTIDLLLKTTAQKHPNQIPIEDELGSMNYAQLQAAIEDATKQLQSNGIQAGMGVGVMGKNSRYFIVMVYAVMACGATVMPISNQLKDAEIANLLAQSGLHYIIDDQSGPENTKNFELLAVGEGWRMTAYQSFQGKAFATHIEGAALIRFTSGTTGQSKGVIISHTSIQERINSANEVLQIGPNDKIVWVLKMAYHFVVSIILYLSKGATIVLCHDFTAESILDACNQHQGTLLYASPMHIRLLARDQSGRNMDSLRMVISTSTAISVAQCEAFLKRYDKEVSQAYGIIEVGLPIINLEKSKSDPDAVGHVLPAYEVEILNDDFEILSRGAIGHLAMRGPGMFDGYLSPPTTRSEILEEGWFMTGDLATKQEDGLIKIEGRKKSMINVSGNKVFPAEVEHTLNEHPNIQLSRVSGFQHRFLGEVVQAEVILKGEEEVDVESIITYCRQRLTTYKLPQKIIFVEELPMTDSGKLLRH